MGDRHVDSLNMELGHAKALRGQARDASIQLRPYIKLLQVADLLFSRSEEAKSSAVAKPLGFKAEAKYEQALERLSELLEVDPTIQRHLDRPMEWTAGGQIGPEQGAVPRVRYHSRHVFGNVEHKELKSRTDIMREALVSAIADPCTTASPSSSSVLSEEQSQKLKRLTKALSDT